jgi:hypothetical protein
MLKIIISIIAVISLCFLAVILNTTTPATAGPFGILTIFFFAYLLSLGIFTYLIYWINLIIARLSRLMTARKPFIPLTFKVSYYYATVISAIPVLLIGLQSVGAIGIYEFLLVITFVVVGCLYVSKRVF